MLQAPSLQASGAPCGLTDTPGMFGSQGARNVRIPISGATGTHSLEALHAYVLPLASSPNGLRAWNWHRSVGTMFFFTNCTQSAPSQVPGEEEAPPA